MTSLDLGSFRETAHKSAAELRFPIDEPLALPDRRIQEYSVIVDPVRDRENVFGVSILPTIPLLMKNENGAPLNTEILFGEGFRVLEEGGGWTKVKLVTNGEEGWIDVPFERMEAEQFRQYLSGAKGLVRDPLAIVHRGGGAEAGAFRLDRASREARQQHFHDRRERVFSSR